ncbi:MAG: hypothetical protein U5L11_01620 [Arhodomonas sp.]|nr:hypothetical protein [Arhodomonas sp.]
MGQRLSHYRNILSIIGGIVRVRVPATRDGTTPPARLRDLASLHKANGDTVLAQVIRIDAEVVSLQVFGGTDGLTTEASVRFLGHPMAVTCSRTSWDAYSAAPGNPSTGGPELAEDRRVPIGGPSVNPMRRMMPNRMIRTDVPMIDVFNSLVESQKIPIFSVAGEPYNALLARIADPGRCRCGGLRRHGADLRRLPLTSANASRTPACSHAP